MYKNYKHRYLASSHKQVINIFQSNVSKRIINKIFDISSLSIHYLQNMKMYVYLSNQTRKTYVENFSYLKI